MKILQSIRIPEAIGIVSVLYLILDSFFGRNTASLSLDNIVIFFLSWAALSALIPIVIKGLRKKSNFGDFNDNQYYIMAGVLSLIYIAGEQIMKIAEPIYL